jgi:tRNA A-37 threonylcarbamoyl transferase component Bud32
MADEKRCPKCAATYAASVVFCPEDGTPLQARDGDPLVGQVVADRYRIITRIGEGGMGQVYLAEHVHMRRRCAVKFLNPDLAGNDFALKRFMREAENASRIDHPNVVTMYDFGESTGGVYLAMEFVDGESLRKRVERQGVLAPELTASVIRQTASALQAAHALHIVHRDLKPDNIMLIERGDELRVKVVDFGIAKARDPKQKVTVTGAIVGTPDYMSPEQVTGDETDGRSDQYALALVAVKLLTGKLPFANTTGVESLTSRLFSEPLSLRSLRADVAWPQKLQDVINRALSPRPDDRFASVTEFAKAFDRALSAIQGAIASTVPEITLSDVVPPTRLSEKVAANAVQAGEGPRRRPPWLMAAAAGFVMAGVGSTYLLTRPDTGDVPPVAPYNLPIGSSSAATTDTAVRQQAAADTAVAAGNRAALPDSMPAATPPAVAPLSRVIATPTRPPRATQRDTAAAAPAAAPAAATVPATAAPTPLPSGAEAKPEPPKPDPVSAVPPRPVTLTSADVSAELARVRPMMTADSPRADVDAALAALERALPKVGQRSDSIRVLYTRAQGLVLTEDLPGACRTLGRAVTLAAGTRLEETIARTSRDLSCP